MREFLSDQGVPFVDRNIRRSKDARAELAERTNELVVPQLFWGDRHVVGFDPEALTELVRDYRDRG
ncbi:MAG: glutaredoxin family protein [Gaiellaceae bacterium MAG52_C11]|nr:glutaredoxin family protein [Candidatus Gaiellasilicea maunaloa]